MQERLDRDAAELGCHRETVGVGVDARAAGEVPLIEACGKRLELDPAARGLNAEIDLLHFHVGRNQPVYLQAAFQVQAL